MNELLLFLADHAPIVSLVKQAIDSGVDKEQILEAIKAEMTKIAREEIKVELGE